MYPKEMPPGRSTARTRWGARTRDGLRMVLTVLVLLLASLPTQFARADSASPTGWFGFQFNDRHLGVNPYEDVLNLSNVGNLTLDWSTELSSQLFAQPV